jgi:hypothetical protein
MAVKLRPLLKIFTLSKQKTLKKKIDLTLIADIVLPVNYGSKIKPLFNIFTLSNLHYTTNVGS